MEKSKKILFLLAYTVCAITSAILAGKIEYDVTGNRESAPVAFLFILAIWAMVLLMFLRIDDKMK